MRCVSRLPAPSEIQPVNESSEAIRNYAFVVAFENSEAIKQKLSLLPLILVERRGMWSLWRVVK